MRITKHFEQRMNQCGISMNIVNPCLERGAPFRDGIIMLSEKLIDNELIAPNENEIREDLLRARKIGGLSIVEAENGDLVTNYPLCRKRLIQKKTLRRKQRASARY